MHGDKPGGPLLDEELVDLAKDQGRILELVSKGVDHVSDQGSCPRRFQAVAGDVADKYSDSSVLDLEHVVEVATDGRLLVAER